MGVNGERWETGVNPRENSAKPPWRSSLLVNRADCRFRAKRVTSRSEGVDAFPLLIRGRAVWAARPGDPGLRDNEGTAGLVIDG
jgi:hypothetical protein